VAEDYYKTLDVKRDASQDEIRKAYRELARKYHPDRNPDDKAARERFQAIQKAFDVLNDPEKREMYDRYGSAFESVGGGAGPHRGGGGGRTYTWSPGGGGPAGGGGGFDFDVDLFGERFGQEGGGGFADLFKQFRRRGAGAAEAGAGPQPGPKHGANQNAELEIPFNTAVTGGEANVSVQRPDGKIDTLAIKIPAGIEEGKKIRLRGQGAPSPAGGQPGDLLVTIHVAPHPHFHRRGKRLDVKVPVTLAEAAAGGKVDVPTPKGTITLTIPPGTSSGKKLRVKGHGVAPANDTPGDLYAEIEIVLPPDMNQEDRQQLKSISDKYSQHPRAELRW